MPTSANGATAEPSASRYQCALMHEPDTTMPAPNATPASASTQLTGPMCMSGGSCPADGSGTQLPKTTVMPTMPTAIASTMDSSPRGSRCSNQSRAWQ